MNQLVTRETILSLPPSINKAHLRLRAHDMASTDKYEKILDFTRLAGTVIVDASPLIRLSSIYPPRDVAEGRCFILSVLVILLTFKAIGRDFTATDFRMLCCSLGSVIRYLPRVDKKDSPFVFR